MTKYSTELKIEIVSKYLNHEDSIKGLAKQYNIHWTLIRRWIDKAKCQGLAALSVKHTKTTYSSDFRLNVVRYYLTHSIGVSKVAAKFNISDSQVYNWAKKFNEEGYAGLLPKQKGRPRKVPKKSKKTTKKLELSEKQKYEEKILKQEAELERLRVENLVLKKWLPDIHVIQQTKNTINTGYSGKTPSN